MLQLQRSAVTRTSNYAAVAVVPLPRCSTAFVARHQRVHSRTNQAYLQIARSGRGEEVVAFLPSEGSVTERTLPATGQDVKVYTMNGHQFTLPLTAGITSVGDIRAYVAQKENAPVDKVRLAYAGRELDPDMDFQVFVPKPGIAVMHAMHRMSGGGAAGGPPCKRI